MRINNANSFTFKRTLAFVLVMACSLVLPACGSHATQKPGADRVVSEIYSGFHCSYDGRSAAIEWVTDALLLERAFTKLSRQFASSTTPPPKVNFTTQRVAIIYMGQQRTAGYSLQLARNELRTYQGTAEVTLAWKKPSPGMMSAQVITSPCVVLSIPANGYQQFQVVDTGGDVRVSTGIPGS